ncbi:unnamed protein product [Aphis gossypii]|uniref:Uncharacterized protein n=1 Tax=Aphis gossypii TaxID=80765 RepID=A0A9P0NG62_APHGO|nr:unnamed protein product [Aphis gossypii]
MHGVPRGRKSFSFIFLFQLKVIIFLARESWNRRKKVFTYSKPANAKKNPPNENLSVTIRTLSHHHPLPPHTYHHHPTRVTLNEFETYAEIPSPYDTHTLDDMGERYGHNSVARAFSANRLTAFNRAPWDA